MGRDSRLSARGERGLWRPRRLYVSREGTGVRPGPCRYDEMTRPPHISPAMLKPGRSDGPIPRCDHVYRRSGYEGEVGDSGELGSSRG